MKTTHKFKSLNGCKLSFKGYTLKDAKDSLKRIVNNPKEWFIVKKKVKNVDLFEYWEMQPKKLAKIVEKYLCQDVKNGGLTYQDCANFLKDVEKIGYTFEYGLDSEPYGLKKIQ